jgi:hypothetical protein
LYFKCKCRKNHAEETKVICAKQKLVATKHKDFVSSMNTIEGISNNKYFIVIVALTLIVCVLALTYAGGNNDVRSGNTVEDIQKFDRQHAVVLNGLAHSLIKSIGKSSAYYCSFDRGKQSHFVFLDSAEEKATGNIQTEFKFSKEQTSFLTDYAIGAITYSKQKDQFGMKIFAFKQQNECVGVVISNAETKVYNVGAGFDTLYTKGNRIYMVRDAW